MTVRSFVQDPRTGKLVPRETYRRNKAIRFGTFSDIEPFVSHVDGSVIGSRSTLREHNRRHGVELAADTVGHGDAEREAREDFYAGRPYDTERRRDAAVFATNLHEREAHYTKAEMKQMVENYRRKNGG